jgi:hypothetical protein
MTIESEKTIPFAYIDFISHEINVDICFVLFRRVDEESRNKYYNQSQTTSTNGKKIVDQKEND